MKICFDGLSIDKLLYTGLYSYTYELINNLLEIFPQPQYYLLSENRYNFNANKIKKNIADVNLDINRIKNDYSKLEKFLTKNKISIYHSPNNGFSIPKEKVCNMVISVQDLLTVTNKEYVDEKYLNKFETVFPEVIENVDKIIAVSEFIKTQLIKYYQVPYNKIEVIYPCISKLFKPLDIDMCRQYIHKKYNISNKFLLFVGSIHKRKNLELLLDSYEKTKLKEKNISLVLIGEINGKRKDYCNKLKDYIRKLNIERNVIFCGGVEYFDMVYFYNACECVINLSSYDGFPLTIIESIECHTPVICSDIEPFREVVGKDGVLINLCKIEEIKDNIINIFDLEYRMKLLKKQDALINNFNNDRSTRKLVRVYESMVYGD